MVGTVGTTPAGVKIPRTGGGAAPPSVIARIGWGQTACKHNLKLTSETILGVVITYPKKWPIPQGMNIWGGVCKVRDVPPIKVVSP
jgi:hypothetical protein